MRLCARRRRAEHASACVYVFHFPLDQFGSMRTDLHLGDVITRYHHTAAGSVMDSTHTALHHLQPCSGAQKEV